jgi:small-conductance mechanosensitive channel
VTPRARQGVAVFGRRWWRAAALAACAALVPLAAVAQFPAKPPKAAAEKAAPKLPEPLTKEAIRELASRLTDAEVRQLLIQQLDRAAAPSKAKPDDMSDMVMSMEKGSQAMRERAAALLQAAAEFPVTLQDAYDKFQEGREPGHFLKVLLITLLALGLSRLAEQVYRHGLRAHRARLDERHDEGFAAQSARNLLRFLLDLGGLAVFGMAALALFYLLYQGHEPSRLLVLTLIGAVTLFRLVALASRFLLEPAAPALRLLPLDDQGARRLHGGFLQVAAIYLAGISLQFLLKHLGAPDSASAVIGLLMGALLLVLVLAMVWAIRHHVGKLIRGPEGGGPLARLFSELWPVLASAYLIVVYGVIVLDVLGGRQPAGKGILSVLLLIALPIVDLFLARLLHAAMTKRAGNQTDAALSYEPVVRKALHIVVALTGLVLIAGLYDVSFLSLAERGLGERLAGELLGIFIILLLAYLLWSLSRTALERLAAKDGGMPAGRTDDEAGGAVASRLGTLLPLIRATLFGTIVVMTVLGVLAAFGINILPLLAGASILGVAIAFGAQTLVRDIVSGGFFLADDAFRVGEYIEVGESKGTVEKIRLRSLFLRHHRGAINILPYGEIRRLRNMSRDWVIDKMTIGITYDSDLDKARKLIKKIGQELAANPEFAPKLLEPLKMQGVEQFGDFAIQIRMKMKTLPNEQFVIRRKAYAMIKKAFDENGIKFAFPTVQVSGGGETNAAVAAAASQVQPKKEP